MTGVDRRQLLVGTGAVLGAGAWPAMATPAGDRITADLDRYIGFGGKASGGAGDTACGAWLHRELKDAGFAVRRQAFDVPFFEPALADLTCGRETAPVIPQAVVASTPGGGATGRLVAAPADPATCRGAVVLVDLPHNRWSSAQAKPIRDAIGRAAAGGAVAVVIVTNGPTGKAIALNAKADVATPIPVAVLAPDAAQPFRDAARAGGIATLRVTGSSGRRSAFNLVGTIDNRRDRWAVISTPRSGWFGCAGERGPGVAVWLDLARWAKRALPGHNLAFLCTSGHEYEYLGAEHATRALVPPPAKTAIWYHLGANVAARDWQELSGTLLPLPSADPQRYLAATPDLIEPARRAFVGQPGLEAPRNTADFAAGELGNIIAAGYPRVAGIFGAHRFHHTREDDARCVVPALVSAAAATSKALLQTALNASDRRST